MINAFTDYELMLGARGFDENLRRRRLDKLKLDLTRGEIGLINSAVQQFVADNKLLIEMGSSQYINLCRLMIRAEIEGLQRTLERDQGNCSGVPKDPIVKPAIGTAREAARPGESIMDLFAIYERGNPRSISADTFNQARRDIGTFLDSVGSTCPVHRVDKKAVREWKMLLMRYPVTPS